MRIIILGSAAGGGFPQWNCRCPNCLLAWNGDPRAKARTQSSLAISADGEHWLLLNASPDLRQQILNNPALRPRRGSRDSAIFAVYLTNGDVDHVAGLLTLREQQKFDLFGSALILGELARASIFAVLNPELVRKIPVEMDEARDMGHGLSATPFAVPGKTPLYLEGAAVEIGAATETTIGLEIAGGGRRALYIPGCAKLTPELLARLQGADALFFDGTTFTDDEMIRLGLSNKTAWRMGHMAMSGPSGSMAGLADVAVGRKVYVHMNNTNPALIDGSPERAAVELAGWAVAEDGMEIVL